MTHIEMQQMIVDNMKEKLQDSVTLRQRINISFGIWFRTLLQNAAAMAPAPGNGGAPPEAGGGGMPADPNLAAAGAPPEGAPA